MQILRKFTAQDINALNPCYDPTENMGGNIEHDLISLVDSKVSFFDIIWFLKNQVNNSIASQKTIDKIFELVAREDEKSNFVNAKKEDIDAALAKIASADPDVVIAGRAQLEKIVLVFTPSMRALFDKKHLIKQAVLHAAENDYLYDEEV